jgi:hypothetical protein
MLLVSTLETAGHAHAEPPRDGRICPVCMRELARQRVELEEFRQSMRDRRDTIGRGEGTA